MTTGALALIIFVAILAQVGVVASLGLYRRRRQFWGPGARAGETSPVAREFAPTPRTPGPAWDGFREFVVRRRAMEDGIRSICSFYLSPADGRPLPAYTPGQCLTFKLLVEDPTTGEPKTIVRCYSLSDRPRPDHYRISIKKIPAPVERPNAPPGLSSSYFHDHVHNASRLMVKAPSGHFHLMAQEGVPVVLVAGGIGITPMLSIVNTLLDSASQTEAWLYWGVRNGAEHIMKAHLQSLAETHTNFHLHVCYSNPSDADVEGVDYRHRGRVDVALLRTTLRLTRHQFYVCGPKSMMESMVPALEEWGVNAGDIHYESFGPASLTRRAKRERTPETAAARPITVTFSHSGKRIAWDPGAGSLLEFAETAGIEVASGCRAGSCGTCQTALEGGEVDYQQRPDVDLEPGHCLLCITTPSGDLTLAA
jgi:ferredoxin-NADP reductase